MGFQTKLGRHVKSVSNTLSAIMFNIFWRAFLELTKQHFLLPLLADDELPVEPKNARKFDAAPFYSKRERESKSTWP